MRIKRNSFPDMKYAEINTNVSTPTIPHEPNVAAIILFMEKSDKGNVPLKLCIYKWNITMKNIANILSNSKFDDLRFFILLIKMNF